MRHTRPWHCVLLGAAIILAVVRVSFAQQDEFADAVQSLLRDHVDLDKKSVGVVVGVVDERGTHIISYGKTDNPASPELNGNTVFEIGSITKVFTTLLLQEMVDRGEMKLDDPVSKYLPKSVKMPARGDKEITLVELATHSSGLPRDVDNFNPKQKGNPYSDYTAEQLYAFLSGYTLTRDPGEKREYSNLGMGLLGHVISLKTGKDYETLIRERICLPLKMESTCIALSPELKTRFAKGHTSSGAPAGNMDFQTLIGNGALRSTADDMLKFLAANCGLAQSDLSPAMERTRTVHIEHQALGWSEDDSGNFWKNGGTFGYHCDAGFNPEKRRAVIVLSNSASDEIDEIGIALMQAEWQSDKRPKPVKIDPHLYDLYAGDYRFDDGSITTIIRKGNRLLRQQKEHLTGELLPKSDSIFFGRVGCRELMFVRDAQGKATQMVFPTNGKFVIATRVIP